MIVLKGLAAALLQFITANVITLLVSFVVNLDPAANPALFVAVAGASFALGIVAGGLLAQRFGWIAGETRYAMRVLLTFALVYGVLGIALFLGEIRVASPFLTGAMAAGILGFHIPGWIKPG